MLDYILRYALFLAQTVTFVVAIGFILLLIVSAASRVRERLQGHLTIRKINEHYDEVRETLQQALLDEKAFKQWQKQHQQEKKQTLKARRKSRHSPAHAPRARVFVLHFEGDTEASQVDHLREEVSAILSIATPEDEVVVRLESPGGVVHGYGLGASQLKRLRTHHIPLTVIIDKVAASGGYLMASVANKIIAAPFAVIGSIGVLMQLPNVHRLLKKHNIDFEMVTAGEYKRTLTVFGENTDKARQKAQEEVNDIHVLFKEFVQSGRPQLDIERVATGEFWFGETAKALNLVDELSTSDDYLLAKSEHCDLFEVAHMCKPTLRERLSEAGASMVERVLAHLFSRHSNGWQN